MKYSGSRGRRQSLALVVAVGSAFGLASAQEAGTSPEEKGVVAAIKSGKPIIDVRYRYEWKDQAGFAENAYANTIRTRLGFETGEFLDLKALVEFENVASIGDDHFNSTTNGRSQFPVIADPDATEINRAQLTYVGIKKTPITIGRQRFNLGNQRFVGAVDFRQNQQTFDAARLSSSIIDGVTIDYVYISRVHRIFGDDHPMGEFKSDSHVFAAAYDAGKFGKFSGYGLLLDFRNAPALSSRTFGVRFENTMKIDEATGLSIGVAGEYAVQRDHAGNPFDYSEDYVHGEGAIAAKGASLKIGYEQLGGDGAIGFATPLATLHKFQGFADVFLTTPVNGIADVYGSVQYDWTNAPFGTRVNFFATYHDFKAENGRVDLGAEIDAGIALKFGKRWTAELKGAVYDGVAQYASRSLIWASLSFQY